MRETNAHNLWRGPRVKVQRQEVVTLYYGTRGNKG
jgi:hypothetical protein